MRFISIILPTYCESGNIGLLIQALLKQKELKTNNLEIVVVDDNSPDGTAQVVQKLINKGLPVKLIIRKKERGLATAIIRGIKQSKGNIIVLMDTDFNHQPKDVSRLIQALTDHKVDLVIGSRYIPGGGIHQLESNKLQFFLSKHGNLFVNKLLKLPIYDSSGGFIAFKRKILAAVDTRRIFQGYGDYCIRFLHQANLKGYKMKEIPIIYDRRKWGKTKTNLSKVFCSYFITALKTKYGY